MSSHFPAKFVVVALLALAGCNKSPSDNKTGSALEPIPASVDARVRPYLNSKAVVMEGKTLYGKYNCSGCHSNGGGGMAPALMDDTWLYGGRIEDIHATIVEGRPNGMPAWAGKIPDQEMWKIATYVRSMLLPGTLAAAKNNTPSQDPVPVPPSVENSQ